MPIVARRRSPGPAQLPLLRALLHLAPVVLSARPTSATTREWPLETMVAPGRAPLPTFQIEAYGGSVAARDNG
eukprot:SAG31_NODE_13771_length_848_cov_0.845127_1_plen_72_part_10